MSLESFVQQALSRRISSGGLFVAFSGGLDSTVLLHLIAKVNQVLTVPHKITAVHINHQLSEYADNWEEHCKSVAEGLGVTFLSETVKVQTDGKGIEAAARDARYRVFERYVKCDDVLLVAHHANDQAETFMLRLMRGAGVLGLAAMREERSLSDKPDSGVLWRPLLSFSKEDLEDYAKEYDLSWVEDDSNVSLDFDRNFLRHEPIPALLSRWPQALKQFSTASSHLSEAQHLLNELAVLDLQNLDERGERYGYSIDYKLCAALGTSRIKNLLRYWCEQKGFSTPSNDQLLQIESQFFSTSAQLSSAIVSWGNCECRQFNGRFYMMPSLKKFTAPDTDVPFSKGDDAISASLGLAGQLAVNISVLPEDISVQDLSVRWRKGGERCTPIGRAHSQTVKKLLQEYQLETWLRDRVPLVYYKDELVAVGDLWLCKRACKNEAVPTELAPDIFSWQL